MSPSHLFEGASSVVPPGEPLTVETVEAGLDERIMKLIAKQAKTTREWAEMVCKQQKFPPPLSIRLTDGRMGIIREGEPMGKGGLGVCWRVDVEDEPGPIIAKCYQETDKDKFAVKEIAALRQLDSSGIPPFKGHGVTHAGNVVICMDEIHGLSWKELLPHADNLPLPRSVLLPLFTGMTDILRRIHELFIHRDLTPRNLFLGVTAGERQIGSKIIDFSMAEAKGAPIENISGTFGYMDPDILPSASVVPDKASDVFTAMVATASEMYTGMPLMDTAERRRQARWFGWVTDDFRQKASQMRENFRRRGRRERDKEMEDLLIELLPAKGYGPDRRASAEEVHSRLLEICRRQGISPELDWHIDESLPLTHAPQVIRQNIAETVRRKTVFLNLKNIAYGSIKRLISAARSPRPA